MLRFLTLIFVLTLAAGSLPVMAQEGFGGPGGGPEGFGGPGSSVPKLENPLKADSLIEFIGNVLDVVIQVAMPFLVLYFVYVGFLFISSRGNKEGIKKAKDAFFYGVIGTAIFLGAFLIALGIEKTVKTIGGGSGTPASGTSGPGGLAPGVYNDPPSAF